MAFDHPGGKLRELGAKSLMDKELLAILISSGTNGHSAEDIADAVLEEFGSFARMTDEPLEQFLRVKGVGDAKTIRLSPPSNSLAVLGFIMSEISNLT